MDIKILNAEDVRALLPIEVCVGLMRRAMTLVAEGRAVQPPRSRIEVPGTPDLLTLMPGHVAEPAALGVKVVTVFPGNFGSGRGSHHGMVLLFDPDDGRPLAILDGREITAIRTAAATAVATDVLARPDATSLAILGYGEQARSHLEALAGLRAFGRIVLWGRTVARAEALAEEMSAVVGRRIEAVADLRAACEADVVTAVTAAAEPLIDGAWLQPGQHLNLVGSSVPSTSEIDDEGVRRSRFFVDSREGALLLAGEFRMAKGRGVIGDEHILGQVGDVMTGRVEGRRGRDDITLFKSLGMASEDLVSADFLLKAARERGVGQTVAW